MTLDQSILAAYDLGIEVILAKRPEDLKRPGIHLLEPTPEQVAAALSDAIAQHVWLVVIHSKATWRSSAYK